LLQSFDSRKARRFFRPVISLTPRAAQQIRSTQTEQNVPGKRLRVLVESGGCSGFQYGMSFDDVKAGDAEGESEGVGLLIDPASLAYLQGSVIDFDDGLHGKGFEIKNPNAQSTCGCGKSFS
jgi:iron-sulfur cluster assembly accessory protein